MPTVKQTFNIIKKTPCEQAILLVGIHGIGKSKIVEKYAKDEGYGFHPLFCGQATDAGDLIGLPDTETNEAGNKRTTFNPPFWWPEETDKPFLLFLDEINRGKPEIMQCIMDLVISRKLMGKSLPKNCMIIGACNNLTDDGFYQVFQLDPALIDRFNRYDFLPSNDEWRDWAILERLHPQVIGFISGNYHLLDPITNIKDGAKINDVQPSRRSWERVSVLLKKNPEIVENDEEIQTFLLGMVGVNATSAFKRYIQSERKNLSANSILINWTREVEKTLHTYSIQDISHMNRQIAFWLENYEEELKLNTVTQVSVTKGLSKYLDIIGNEMMMQLLSTFTTDKVKGKSYATTIMRLNDDLSERYFKILEDQEEEEKELFDNIKGE